MKSHPYFLQMLAAGVVVLHLADLNAQAPSLPKVPRTEPAKNAEAAEKAATKAEAASKNAQRAESSQKASEKAAAAQKAAEKSQVSQRAAEKAEAAQKAAAKAEVAQKAAAKAEVAQKAAAKAEVAQRAAARAETAQKAAAKAEVAQKAAAKAEVAQRAAAKAEVAERASVKAEAAQRAAAKAEVAQKAAAQASVSQRAASVEKLATKVDVSQKSASKAEAAERAAARAQAAEKAGQKALTVDRKIPGIPTKAQPHPILTPRKLEIPSVANSAPRSTPAPELRSIREEKIRSLREVPDKVAERSATVVAEQTEADRRVTRESYREQLESIQLDPKQAARFADELTDPAKTPNARDRVEQVVRAEEDLQIAGVDELRRKDIINEVSVSKNPEEAANEKVGEAAIESFFGKDVAELVPPEKRKQNRDVFTRLLDIEGSLEVLGGEPDDAEVVEAVEEGARLGLVSREDARKIVDKAANKILDRQGFSSKEGESLKDRLNRLAQEQEAEVREQKAAEARARGAALEALRKEAVAKARALPSGAASTTVGRSVSTRVEVAIGGGTGNASGVGKAASGVGVDASRTAGTGGARESAVIDRTLVAGTGGNSNAGAPVSGVAESALPGTAAPPQSPTDAVPGSAQPAGPGTASEAAVPNVPAQSVSSDVNAGGAAPAQADGQVSTVESEIVVGGGAGTSSAPVHVQSPDGNTGGDLVFSSDGTFQGTVTTVTRDANGNITSSQTQEVTGTWGTDGEGNVTITSATTAPSSGAESGQAAQNQNPSTGGQDSQQDSESGDSGAQAGASPTPPPEESGGEEEAPPAESSEEQTAGDSTPNPMDEGGGNPMNLAEKSEGRLGGSEARRQRNAITLAASGEKTGGPNAKDGQPSGVLLTSEERANAERFLAGKTGGGVTNPSTPDKGGMTVTDRDLRELHLRGNGGASGPVENDGPRPPQDPRSPVGGLQPAPAPSTALKGATIAVPKVQIDTQVQDQIKAGVR